MWVFCKNKYFFFIKKQKCVFFFFFFCKIDRNFTSTYADTLNASCVNNKHKIFILKKKRREKAKHNNDVQ